jgi:LmbE family N-acetylglucosaminyl deacetylase
VEWRFNNCAVIVAHPDDETLWAGGTILLYPETDWTIVTLCRGSDPDRAPKFRRVLDCLGATGRMADLDDGPDQNPLPETLAQRTILDLLADKDFDLIITHSLHGEYTRHLRHEETAQALLSLWDSARLKTRQVWMFAYEDGRKQYFPRPIDTADKSVKLPQDIWQKKYDIITDTYGFAPDTFEARTTPRTEAFWCFDKPDQVEPKLVKGNG